MNWSVILGALLAVSEVLALIPGIKSNSIFTLIFNLLHNASKTEVPAPPASLKK